MKILANDGISTSGKAALQAAGIEVVTEKVPQDQLISAINKAGYTGILVRSATTVRRALIDACPTIRLIGRGGVGMDNIDVEYARSKGLQVINTPASSSQSVAELVMAHLFSISRSLYDANRKMPDQGTSAFKALKKRYAKGSELRGKTIGFIGFGRIGQHTAKYALGCGMKVLAYDPFVENASVDLEIEGAGTVSVPIKMVGMETLLAQADCISLHVPAQADGAPVIGAEEFGKMKDGVLLVNAARGGVADEDALLAALNSGKVAHAALDVFVGEPSPRADVLAHERMSLSPHIGAATQEAQDRIGTELAGKIIAYFKPESAG